ncbi:MAG: protoheme IX farnesyltransferase [Candidatus Omnitrophica bacterium]|nr:protoheme IX farnesyltransferase [Candidatus Omnitrophota bacterium]
MRKKNIVSAYLELTKPRIVSLVLVSCALGFFLGGHGIHSWPRFVMLLVGVALVSGGSGTLNHYLEREYDAKMLRTRNRPIPSGIIAPADALGFGVVLILAGIFILYVKTNILTAFLSLLTSFLYIMVYTPMKRVSWLNTTIGAVPGAIPPLGGWAAATGHLNFSAGILFLILFLWQHPHFYSIAWMIRDDYARAGFKMLPVLEPDGRSTFSQIQTFSGMLIVASLLPTMVGLSGYIYAFGVGVAGVVLWGMGRRLTETKSLEDARNLLKATVFYLPVLFVLIVVDLCA